MLADKLVVFAAVDDREPAFGEVVAGIDAVCVFAEELPGALGGVYDTQGVEICRLVGEGRRDGDAFVAVLAGQAAAKFIISAVGGIEIVGQGEAVACLRGDQATEKFGGK